MEGDNASPAVVEQVLRLLYPSQRVSELRAVVEPLIESPVIDLRDLRRVLNAIDRHVAQSPVTVRFGPQDIVRHTNDEGFVLFLDKDDMSVSRPILDGNAYEPYLGAAFREFCSPGMTVVDAGANVGHFAILASGLVGPTGRVFAVEPNSENCRLILMAIDANQADNVELLPVALGKARGWSYFSTAIGSNGCLRSGDPASLMDGYGLIVPTFPLDELVAGPVHFLKLDVEGAEGLAVAGARRLIEKWQPIITSEFSLEMLERVSSISGAEYLEWFEDLGYTISILNRETGTPDQPISARQLLAAWPGHSHIEDLLFRPDTD